MRKAALPTIKFVHQPTKSVRPVYSPAAIAQHEETRARQQQIYDRKKAEIEARRKERAAQATRKAVVNAMADRSTRH